MGTDTQIETAAQTIIFFDGVCNLCNGAVRFIIKRDSNNYFKFSSLQSDKAKEILSGFKIDPAEMESIILLDKSGIHFKSNAILTISKRLSGIWPVLTVFWIIPRRVRDFIYDWVADNRYKWFGRKDQCMVPTANLRSRFIEI